MTTGFGQFDQLTETVGPRPPGSTSERRMAHLVADRLEELNIPHATLHFRTVRGTATLYLVPFAGLVLSVAAAWWSPIGGLIAATIFALIAVLEATNRPTISRLLRLDSSQNVIGLIPHNPRQAQRDGNPARRVILVAHLDSPRRGWIDSPGLQSSVHALTIATLICIAIIPIVLSVNLFVEGQWPVVLAGVLAAVVLSALIALIQRDAAGAEDPGRNDNASGISTVLAVAEELKRYPPLATETLLVFSGASQAGSAGMTDFLTENRFNPETTYFINLESVGRGPICFTRAEGAILSLQSSPALTHIAGDIALSEPERLMRPIVHRGLPTEQYAALIRGYQAITIMGHPDPKESTSTPDAIRNDEVDPSALESAYLLTHGIIRRLDEEAAVDGFTQSSD